MTTPALYKEAEAIAHQLNLDNHEYFSKHNCYVGMLNGKLQLANNDEEIKAMDWMFQFKAYYHNRVEPVIVDQRVVMRKQEVDEEGNNRSFEFLEGDFVSSTKVVLLGETYQTGQRYKNKQGHSFTLLSFVTHMLSSFNKELLVVVLFDGQEMYQAIPLTGLRTVERI